MADEPLATRFYHALPDTVSDAVLSLAKQSDLLLTLRFYFGKRSILRERNWLASERKGIPLDPTGNPTPWYTYPAVDFVDDCLPSDARVFEWGSGYSTKWYADRTDAVTAVEHNSEWYDIVRKMLTDVPEAEVLNASRDTYAETIRGEGPFEVIAVDGPDRIECSAEALSELTDDGVLIWDDTNRHSGDEDEHLLEAGFHKLPLSGLSALGPEYTQTTIYYRDDNCLGI